MKRNTKGSSLISVVIAFLLLLIILVIFQRSLQLTNRLLQEAVTIREETNELVGEYYMNKESSASQTVNSYSFSGAAGAFRLTTQWSSYAGEHGTIYYFGNGVSGSVSGGIDR